jgi:hypothetical protein
MADEFVPDRRSSTNAIFDRIGHIEREFADTRAQIAGMGVNLAGLSQSFARVQQLVEARSSTDWKGLAAWASVILAVVGFGIQLILGPIRAGVDAQGEAIRTLNEYRVTDARAQTADVRMQIDLAERRGRELERVEQLRLTVDKLVQEHLGEAPPPAP